LMRMIGRERMALAGPKALNFCTEQLRAGRGALVQRRVKMLR
jgi:hypothetical protein